jgi:quercetin dioxygenase-like cupin family protein
MTTSGTAASPATGSDSPLDLRGVAEILLAESRQSKSGRSARTLTPGAGAPLKQTLMALTSGARLSDHVSPGPATLYVLEGEVALTHGDQRRTLTPGMWTPIPRDMHGLEALTDAVALITVVTDSA